MNPGSSDHSRRSLASVRRDLDDWRQEPGRTRRIPEPLWAAAVAVARDHGVAAASRALGLDYYALKKRVESSGLPGSGFVEVAWPATSPAPEGVLELEDGRGGRLRVELRGAAVAEVAAVACALWRAAQ
jgi:hypothetical protein